MTDNLNQIQVVDTDDIDSIIRKNNYKLTADKIKQILSKILNDPAQSSKRWIWELMQNAKDLKNKFEKVSVKIELSETELVFSHNGDPFKMANITGLIQQVSSKDSGNTDEEVTGKFGTGFIATHLLSDIIVVNGVVEHKNIFRDFEVILDRSGRTSEDLLPKIELALENIRNIEKNPGFVVKYNYDQQRVESDFDTSFTYSLSNTEKLKAAKDGIDDLKNTLPTTLVNIPKIKSVTIVNNIDKSIVEYKSEEISDINNIRKTRIKLSESDTRYFITYYTNDLSLSVEVDNFVNIELIEHFGETPNLYRDFPLIGSDKFYFPFLLNGFKFHPNENRDGIPIHSESAPDHIENRDIVEKAFAAAMIFTDYLISINAKNLYVCAFSRMPKEKWQEFSKPWYEKLQKDYRSFVDTKVLMETDIPSNEILSSVVVPVFGDSDDDKFSFYDIVEPFKGAKQIPKRDLLVKWYKATGPKDELESWNRKIRYPLTDFLGELQNCKSFEILTEKFANETEAINWLNSLYKFLIEFKETSSFVDFAIIPNQNGEFKKIEELQLEDPESIISDEFLDILFNLEDNWRNRLIHRKVLLPGQNIDKKGLLLASNRINELITLDKFKTNVNSFKIIIDILRNVVSLSNIDNFRCEVLLKAKDIFHFEEDIREVKNIKDFNFKPALTILIEKINLKIENSINIEGLSKELVFSLSDTVTWLSLYLNRLKGKEDFSQLLVYGNIVPNRYGIFCAFEDLHNFGTPTLPLNDELIDILLKIDTAQDWKKELVLDGINIGCSIRTFEELGSAVDSAIRELEKEEAVSFGYIDSYKDHILELIEWLNKYPNLCSYLSHFTQKKNDFWVKFSMTEKMLSLLRDNESLEILEAIQNSNISIDHMKDIIELFPDGIPENVMRFAREEARLRREFNNLLDVGSKVERLVIEALKQYEVSNEIIHAGGGAYDIRVYNPETKKSFYIEVKSCHFGNSYPISLAISQVDRAVTEVGSGKYGIIIIERSNGNVMDSDYIKSNTKFLRNPGQYLSEISNNYDLIDKSANTNKDVDLKMNNAEFKGSLNYNWVKSMIGNCGFNELISDINSAIS